MFSRFASTLPKLKEAYQRNSELKTVIDKLKLIMGSEKPSSTVELYKLMQNKEVQQLSVVLQRELAKENISMMDAMAELRSKK